MKVLIWTEKEIKLPKKAKNIMKYTSFFILKTDQFFMIRFLRKSLLNHHTKKSLLPESLPKGPTHPIRIYGEKGENP